jgi:O-antigen/teichoic acid export membrane protein
MGIRERAIGNIAVQWLEKAVVTSLRLASFIIMARTLSPGELGKYSLVTSVALFFLFLTDMGLDDTLVKMLATRPSQGRALLADLLLVKVALAVVSSIGMLAIVVLLGYDSQVLSLALIASATIVLGSLAAVATAYFRVNLQLHFVAAGNAASALFFLGAVLFVGSRNGQLLLYMTGWSLAAVINLLVVGFFFVRMKPLARPPIDRAGWLIIARATLPLGLAYLLSQIYMSVDVVILSRLADFEATGVYSAAYKFVYVGIMFPYAFINTLYPLMARYWQTDRARLRELLQQGFDYMNLLAWPVAVSIWLLAPELMATLFRKQEYAEGALVLQLLGVALALMFLDLLTHLALVATDRQKVRLKLGVVGIVTNIGLNLLLVPLYSNVGAAVATIVTEIVVLVPGLWLLMEAVEMRLSFRILPKALAAAALCAAAIHFTRSEPLFMQLLLLALVYPAAILLSRAVKPKEFLSVLKRPSEKDTWPWGETP